MFGIFARRFRVPAVKAERQSERLWRSVGDNLCTAGVWDLLIFAAAAAAASCVTRRLMVQ